MLVKPLIPTQLHPLLDQKPGTNCDINRRLQEIMDQIQFDKFELELADECKLHRTRLDADLISLRNKAQADRTLVEQTEKLLFCALILESLLNLRIHAAQEARLAVQKARCTFKSSSINKVIALESLGVLEALVTELEDQLARIEPCIFSSRFFQD